VADISLTTLSVPSSSRAADNLSRISGASRVPHLRRLGAPSVDVGEAVSEEEIVVACQKKKRTGGDGVRSTMQDRSSAMYAVRVDGKRRKANFVENGTTKEPTVKSIGLTCNDPCGSLLL